MSNNNAIIELKNIGVFIGEDWVLKNLNLAISPNKIATIIGASGAGKTTLVRAILMLQPIAEGEIFIENKKITNYDLEDPITKLSLSHVGMMFQQGALFSSLTTIENVMFPLQEYTDFNIHDIIEIARIKLRLTGLDEKSFNKFPRELSPGMIKRVSLARTLSLDPSILFLDEPTTGLDPNSAHNFDILLSNLQKQLNLTIIMITHDLDSIWSISDEIIYIGDKKILLHDTVVNAANNNKLKELNEYFNGSRGLPIKEFYSKHQHRRIQNEL